MNNQNECLKKVLHSFHSRHANFLKKQYPDLDLRTNVTRDNKVHIIFRNNVRASK